MTGAEFVKLCREEKEAVLREYFSPGSQARAAGMIRCLVEGGTDGDALRELIDLVLRENYYRLLLALDGEASLGGTQTMYRLYDEDQNLLNGHGEIEAAAYECFMEEADC